MVFIKKFKSLKYRISNFITPKSFGIRKELERNYIENNGRNLLIECYTGYHVLNCYYIVILHGLIKKEAFNNIYLLYKKEMDRHIWSNRLLQRITSGIEVVLDEDKVNNNELTSLMKGINKISELEFKGFNIGQDVYFSKLRNLKQGSADLNPKKYENEIRDFVSRYNNISQFIINKKIDLILLSDIAYNTFLPVFIAGVNNDIQTIVSFPYGKTGKIGGRSYTSKSDYLEASRCFPFSFTDNTWDKSKSIDKSTIEQFCVERFSGKTELFDGCYQKGKVHGIKELNLPEKKYTALVACHLAWDNPGYSSLFDDYIDWVTEVASIAKNRTDINWVFKVHPSEKFLGTNSQVAFVLNDFYESEIPENVRIIDSVTSTNTYQLIDDVDFVVTVRGTITFEAASLGKLVITAGKGPHSSLNIAKEFDKKSDFVSFLNNMHSIDIDPDSQAMAKRAMYTYMNTKAINSEVIHNLFNEELLLEKIISSDMSDNAIDCIHNIIENSKSGDIIL